MIAQPRWLTEKKIFCLVVSRLPPLLPSLLPAQEIHVCLSEKFPPQKIKVSFSKNEPLLRSKSGHCNRSLAWLTIDWNSQRNADVAVYLMRGC